MQTGRIRPAGSIRPVARCVFWHGARILVASGYDAVARQTFYRPLGGRIECGERSQQTIVREMREELGAAVTALRYLSTLENIFTYQGQPRHEIILVYDGRFCDADLYERAVLEGRTQTGAAIRARWTPLEAFSPEQAPLYPVGLSELLRSSR